MYPEGFTSELAVISALLVAVCALLVRPALGASLSLVVAAIRIGITAVYFSWYAGTFVLSDDRTYFRLGLEMMDLGFGPWSILADRGAREVMKELTGGGHILYPWWNMITLDVFGNHYYSPVFTNVVLTFVGAYAFNRILLFLEFGRSYRQLAVLFFLLHWDVIVWSSFINLKDTLVMTMTEVGFLGLLGFMRSSERRWPWLVLAALSLGSFVWLRFYVPMLVLGSTGIWLILDLREYRNTLYWGVLVAVAYYLLRDQYAQSEEYMEYVSVVDLMSGPVRAILTPRPWGIDNSYRFLFLPAILHWLMLGPALVGAVLLWRASRHGRILLIYLGLTLLSYGVVPELQGPRQRVQTTFVLAWIQFHAIWWLVTRVRIARAAPVQSLARVV